MISPHVLCECESWSLVLWRIWIEGVQNMDTRKCLDLGEKNKVELCNSSEGHPESKDNLATKKSKIKNSLQTLSYFSTESPSTFRHRHIACDEFLYAFVIDIRLQSI